MGRSYLDVAWARTSLGDPAGWSDSLNSTVRLMLASRFSMWMGWGPDLTFFCNEAYRRDTLAHKYPWALGRPTREVWSEIWDQLTDRVAAVTTRGESTWDEELRLFVQRAGFEEETFHTFSYSPLTDGDGTIAGLLCVVNEVTRGVINSRRIAALGELSAGLAEAVNVGDVRTAARSRLAMNPTDFPFVAAYERDSSGDVSLSWVCGTDTGRSDTPSLELDDPDVPWSRSAAATDVEVIATPAGYFDTLIADPERPRPTHAVIAPITQPGSLDDDGGILVVGASPNRPLDEEYLGFIRLVAEQFGAATTRARTFELERDQANALAAREHAIARDLQESLLPAHVFHADHLDVATFYRAGVEGTDVGGDWYDVIDLGPGRTGLVIGDVMGRGVRAAAVMGQLRAAVRAYARLELSPDAVLGLLDETVRELGANRIVTCIYAIYEPADHTLTYANAGHLPPLLTEPGAPTRALPGGGAPLGAGRGWPTAQTLTLPVDATLTLYTDGLVERRGTNIDDGISQLTLLMDSTSGSLAETPERLVGELMPAGADDDIAVLIARVSARARDDRSARLDLRSDTSQVSVARQFVVSTLTGWRVDTDTVLDAQLIVSELTTNAILHAASDAVLTVRSSGTRLFLEVHDNAATAPKPRNALPSDTNGRGLAIVATLATRWGTRQTPTGKAIWCELLDRGTGG